MDGFTVAIMSLAPCAIARKNGTVMTHGIIMLLPFSSVQFGGIC